MTLPLFDKAPADLPARLVNALRLGRWIHREQLARILGVSVRQVKQAAAQSNGQVLSGQLGLCLTVCATPEEVEAALGAMASQVHETSQRIVATRFVFESRMKQEKSA